LLVAADHQRDPGVPRDLEAAAALERDVTGHLGAYVAARHQAQGRPVAFGEPDVEPVEVERAARPGREGVDPLLQVHGPVHCLGQRVEVLGQPPPRGQTKIPSRPRWSAANGKGFPPPNTSTPSSRSWKTIGIPRKLWRPLCRQQSASVTRESARTSAISSCVRSAGTQPTSPSPSPTVRRRRAVMPPATARASSRFAIPSRTHTDTAGTCISSTAEAAMPESTSSGSSEDETSWLRRARVCTRAGPVL